MVTIATAVEVSDEDYYNFYDDANYEEYKKSSHSHATAFSQPSVALLPFLLIPLFRR